MENWELIVQLLMQHGHNLILFKFVGRLLFYVVCTRIMTADIYTDSFYVEYT